MKKFWKWLDEDFEESLMMILLLAMTVVMMAQVIMRQFVGKAMDWPEEFCRYTFVLSGFLSIGYCIRREKMLKVDILLGIFPEWLKVAVDLIGRVLTLVFFAYLGYYGIGTTMNSFKGGMKSPAMGIPMYILYGAVVVGSFIGVLRQIQDLYRWFKKRGEKEEA